MTALLGGAEFVLPGWWGRFREADWRLPAVQRRRRIVAGGATYTGVGKNRCSCSAVGACDCMLAESPCCGGLGYLWPDPGAYLGDDSHDCSQGSAVQPNSFATGSLDRLPALANRVSPRNRDPCCDVDLRSHSVVAVARIVRLSLGLRILAAGVHSKGVGSACLQQLGGSHRGVSDGDVPLSEA